MMRWLGCVSVQLNCTRSMRRPGRVRARRLDHLPTDRTAVGRVRVRALLGTAQLSDLVASVDPTRDFAGLDDLLG
jgi:hypothetical protein